MSEATPSPTQPDPAPSAGAPASEPFDVKVKKLLAPFMPSADASQETPEMKMLRAIYILIAVALVVFIMCGGLALVVSAFR